MALSVEGVAVVSDRAIERLQGEVDLGAVLLDLVDSSVTQDFLLTVRIGKVILFLLNSVVNDDE